MSTKRARVLLPEELLREIDALVGPRGRSSFLVETARNEVRRQKLLQLLENESPGGKNAGCKHHPELNRGAAAWVRKLRTESEARRTPRKRTSRKRRTQ
jgi:metal-responsive CopG/Arc/MetJ family transcriptional regulator